jgi:hypothetical protein
VLEFQRGGFGKRAGLSGLAVARVAFIVNECFEVSYSHSPEPVGFLFRERKRKMRANF